MLSLEVYIIDYNKIYKIKCKELQWNPKPT